MNNNKLSSSEFIWWKHGTIYQIYPRSFYDSNNDGIGDLKGIIKKIDYLKDLGVDAIWLSPINKSPMYDFGYDISDYREIDKIFGSKHDLFELIKKAHNNNIHVIMDLVINHTSHLHPWFLASRSSRLNSKRNWYIWHDGKNGLPPNNWTSALGSSAWKWDEHTHSYYMHSFLPEQPDLNWRNKEVKKAVFNDIQYWLDNGIDGFRIDVVNWLFKDKYFRNNIPSINPFNPDKYKYMRNLPETHELLVELRQLLNTYNAMSVGEVFTFPPGNPSLSAKFLGNGNDQLHMAFDFSLIYKKWNAHSFYRYTKKWLSKIPSNGWPCHVLSNHDQSRSYSRLGSGRDARKRAFVTAMFLLTQQGTPFLYYGEEIGMANCSIGKNNIVDPLGKKFWPIYSGRDKARTPMQWDSKKYAGFSIATPWLPINKNYRTINVAEQENDPNSLLSFYKKLISIRRSVPALHLGDWVPLTHGYKGILYYLRKTDTDSCLIILNFLSKNKKIHTTLKAKGKVLISTHQTTGTVVSVSHYIASSYEATIIRLM